METEYLHMIENLVVGLSALLLFAYIVKKIKFGKTPVDQHIKIIHAIPIGSKEKILLMTVNNTKLLIGATPNHIETLYVFSEAANTEKPITTPAMKDSIFAEAFTAVR
jgi:flagellar protein FliO/FliZ